MLQCQVAAKGEQFQELIDLGWRVKRVANGQATMVKGNYLKAERAKARRLIGRQCHAPPNEARGVGPDRYPGNDGY